MRDAMSVQPTFTVQFESRRSRLTTFFRYLLTIPQFIVGAVYGFLVMFTAFAAWLIVSLTGRYPAGLYEWHANFARWSASVNGYLMLLTDDYPPIVPTGADHAVRLTIGPPQERYSRAKAFFRFLLLIPPLIINYALGIVASVCAFVAWFAIVITGRQPEGLQHAIELGVSYQARLTAYWLLLTESWPPVSGNDLPVLAAPPAGDALPSAAPAAEQPAVPARTDQPNPFGQ